MDFYHPNGDWPWDFWIIADSWSRRFAVNPQLRQLQISGSKGLQTTKRLGNATKNVCDVYFFSRKRCHVFFFTVFLLETKLVSIDVSTLHGLFVGSFSQWPTDHVFETPNEPRLERPAIWRHVVSPWGVRSYDDSDRVWKIRAYELGGPFERKEASAVDAMAQLLGRFGHLEPCFFLVEE